MDTIRQRGRPRAEHGRSRAKGCVPTRTCLYDRVRCPVSTSRFLPSRRRRHWHPVGVHPSIDSLNASEGFGKVVAHASNPLPLAPSNEASLHSLLTPQSNTGPRTPAPSCGNRTMSRVPQRIGRAPPIRQRHCSSQWQNNWSGAMLPVAAVPRIRPSWGWNGGTTEHRKPPT